MRTNQVILIAGTRGTGKTDFVKNMIVNQSKRFAKCLVVDTFNSPVWQDLSTYNFPNRIDLVPVLSRANFPRWKKGIARIFDSNTNVLMSEIQEHAQNTFIVFEDATRYVGSRLTDDMRRFVLDSKQKNLDLVFIFHNLTAIPPELVRVSDILVLFKTNEGKVNETKYPWAEIPVMMKKLKEDPNRFANLALKLN